MLNIASEVSRMQRTIEAACTKLSISAPYKVHTKDSGGYAEHLTDIDIALSNALLKAARKVLPQSYSEEDLPEHLCNAEYLWQIDPLDGTDEFINGLTEFCGVSAALLKQATDNTYSPVAGLLYLPLSKIMVIGDKTSGTVRITGAGEPYQLPDRNLSTVRGYMRTIDQNPEMKHYYEEFASAIGTTSSIIESGGAVHAFISLILDKVNVVCLNYDYSKEWDVSAAQPILELLGGFICDLDGNFFTYNRQDHFNRRGFLASIAFPARQLLAIPISLVSRKPEQSGIG